MYQSSVCFKMGSIEVSRRVERLVDHMLWVDLCTDFPQEQQLIRKIARHAAAFFPVTWATNWRTSAGMGAAPLFRSASRRCVSS